MLHSISFDVKIIGESQVTVDIDSEILEFINERYDLELESGDELEELINKAKEDPDTKDLVEDILTDIREEHGTLEQPDYLEVDSDGMDDEDCWEVMETYHLN